MPPTRANDNFIRLPFLSRCKVHALCICALIFVAGCDSSSTGSEVTGTGTATPAQVKIIPVPEGSPYLSTIGDPAGITDWQRPGEANPTLSDTQASRDAARQAIISNATLISAADYAVLSLPDFVTTTRTLSLQPSQIDGRDLLLEAFGSDAATGRWVLYSWQGPEIPQRSDRPLVHRWVHIYALVDMKTNQVFAIYPSIVGQVYE